MRALYTDDGYFLSILLAFALCCAGANKSRRETVDSEDGTGSAADAFANNSGASENIPIMGTNLVPYDLQGVRLDDTLTFTVRFQDATNKKISAYTSLEAELQKSLNENILTSTWAVKSSNTSSFDTATLCKAVSSRFQYVCNGVGQVGNQITIDAVDRLSTAATKYEISGSALIGSWLSLSTERLNNSAFLPFHDSIGNWILGPDPNGSGFRIGYLADPIKSSPTVNLLDQSAPHPSAAINWSFLGDFTNNDQLAPSQVAVNFSEMSNNTFAATVIEGGSSANSSGGKIKIARSILSPSGKIISSTVKEIIMPASGFGGSDHYINVGRELGILRTSYDSTTKKITAISYFNRDGEWREFTNLVAERTFFVASAATFGAFQEVRNGFTFSSSADSNLTMQQCILSGPTSLVCGEPLNLTQLCASKEMPLTEFGEVHITIRTSALADKRMYILSGLRVLTSSDVGIDKVDTKKEPLLVSIVTANVKKETSSLDLATLKCSNVTEKLGIGTQVALSSSLVATSPAKYSPDGLPLIFLPIATKSEAEYSTDYSNWMSSKMAGSASMPLRDSKKSLVVIDSSGHIVKRTAWEFSMPASGWFYENGIGIIDTISDAGLSGSNHDVSVMRFTP